jgi:hypothetical protein
LASPLGRLAAAAAAAGGGGGGGGSGGGGGRACDRAEWSRHLEPCQDGALERIDEAVLLVDDGEADGREAQAVGEQERLGRHELGQGERVLRHGDAARPLDRRVQQGAPALVALEALEPQHVGRRLAWLGWGLAWLGSALG